MTRAPSTICTIDSMILFLPSRRPNVGQVHCGPGYQNARLRWQLATIRSGSEAVLATLMSGNGWRFECARWFVQQHPLLFSSARCAFRSNR